MSMDADYNRVGRILGGPMELGAAQAGRQAAVPAAIDHLEKSVTALLNVVDSLESRLASVLSPTPAGNSGGAKEGHPVPVIANQINCASASVRHASSRLQDIFNRLEL